MLLLKYQFWMLLITLSADKWRKVHNVDLLFYYIVIPSGIEWTKKSVKLTWELWNLSLNLALLLTGYPWRTIPSTSHFYTATLMSRMNSFFPDYKKVIPETSTVTPLEPCLQVTDPLCAMCSMKIHHSPSGVLESSDTIMTVKTLENCKVPYKFKLF